MYIINFPTLFFWKNLKEKRFWGKGWDGIQGEAVTKHMISMESVITTLQQNLA